MKPTLFLSLLLLTLIACNHKDTFRIKGEIKDAPNQSVYLQQIDVDRISVIDSTKTNRNGKFSFKVKVQEPTFYNLQFGNNQSITLLGEPETEANITGSASNLSRTYEISGSENSALIKLLNNRLAQTQQTMDSLRKAYTAVPADPSYDPQRIAIQNEWNSVIEQQTKFSRNFIIKHAVSPVAYYALYQKLDPDNFVLMPDTDLQSYRIVISSMQAIRPESQYTKALSAHYEQIMKQKKNQTIRTLIENSENNLPEINLPDVKGDSIRLSQLRGKYILLDFTVLGAKESAAHIKQLKDIYQKYRNKGLEIYQVCLDPNQLQWEELVRQFDIKWKCVRDGAGTQSQVVAIWNVQSIPFNYIINKEYEIAGKNLFGSRLDDRLKVVVK